MSATFRLLVCGGRGYADSVKVERVLNASRESALRRGFDLVIIEGGASGVDAYAHRWARQNGVTLETGSPAWLRTLASTGGAILLVLGFPILVVLLPLALAWRLVLEVSGWPHRSATP